MLKKLDFPAVTYLLKKILPLADNYYQLVEQLEKNGVLAFKSGIEAMESFAKNETELLQHRQATIETAKEALGDPFACAFELEDEGKYCPAYRSVWLPKMRDELCRNENIDLNALIGRQQEWAFLASPCARAYWKLPYEERMAHRRAELSKLHQLRRQEVNAMFNKAIFGPLPEDDQSGTLFAHQRFAEAFAPFGFSFSSKISTKTIHYYTKSLIDDWVICITIFGSFLGGNSGRFKYLDDGSRVRSSDDFSFYMDLRRSAQKGFRTKKLSSLPLQIAEASPLHYCQSTWYNDLDELAAAIKSYAVLYSLVAEKLEGWLIEGLQELDGETNRYLRVLH